jgi:prefoldin subunit 5
MDNKDELKKILENMEFRIKNLEHRVQKLEDSARRRSVR